MPEPIIKVKNLSKQYRIGAKEEGYKTFREAIIGGIKAPIKNIRNLRKLTKFDDISNSSNGNNVVWALKDVSFEVKEGEVIGIIGKNGAGKSTLLRILSRITEPSDGYAKIYGRVSSLLEVGTGFHPELTGRENIYLNGTILGMRKEEIKRKFDEIVDFSGVEKFLDTPVKRYSSGMKVRLAFAVAAHLEPEILIIDEVLAVGDAQFQKKCLGKMGDVAKEGRTVLFVSHNMAAVQQLCYRTLLLMDGSILMDGKSNSVVDHYLREGVEDVGERCWDDKSTTPGDDVVRLRAVRLISKDNSPIEKVQSDHEFGIQIEFITLIAGQTFNVGVHLFNEKDIQILTSLDNHDPEWHGNPRPAGRYKVTCYIPANFLAPGMVSVTVQIKCMKLRAKIHFREYKALIFHVRDAGNIQKEIHQKFLGVVRPLLQWATEYDPELP
tara:strand:- start:2329 stop:3642 length:1314 start_codon:yes stop_codon:yes gene_type:complete